MDMEKISGIMPAAVNAQRDMGGAGLPVHAAAAENTAGVLHRDTAVRLGKDDDQYYRHQDDNDIDDQPRGIALGQEALLDQRRVTGDDAAEDDNRNTVADAVFGNKLAQPDQEHVPAISDNTMVNGSQRVGGARPTPCAL